MAATDRRIPKEQESSLLQVQRLWEGELTRETVPFAQKERQVPVGETAGFSMESLSLPATGEKELSLAVARLEKIIIEIEGLRSENAVFGHKESKASRERASSRPGVFQGIAWGVGLAVGVAGFFTLVVLILHGMSLFLPGLWH